jgi:predicted PurR-regulated permease PerM
VALTIFYLAAALAVLMVGAGALWAAWQISQLVKHVRQVMLPQANLILTEFQRSLNHVEALTQEVNQTVEEANHMVHQANRAVSAMENGVTSVGHTLKHNVARPIRLGTASAWQGLKAGVRVLRGKKPPVALMPMGESLSAEAAAEPSWR